MDNNRTGNNFLSGFLLGALVGAVMVFLFGTKKGKDLLKAISEKGLDNISNILEKADKTEDLAEIHEEDEEEDVVPKRELAVKEVIEEKPKAKRFFKGISRHLN